MTTAIEIVNAAIANCGAAPIGSFDDDIAEARLAKAKYPSIKDHVLEAREWTFAKFRLLLAKSAAVPAFGYQFTFVLPSTVIRVIRVYDGGSLDVSPLADWVREGFSILTNEDAPIYAEVLQRVDEGMFSPGMVMALQARLTSEFAIPITENRVLAKDYLDLYKALLVDAAAMDGGQGRSQQLRPPELPGRRRSS